MFLSTKLNILLPITIFFILGIAYSNSSYQIFSSANIFLPTLIIVLVLIATSLIIFANKTKIISINIFSKKNISIILILALSFAVGIACHKRQIQRHEAFLNKINNKTYKSIIATVKDIKNLENKRNSVYLELNWESENRNVSLYTNNGYDLEVGDKIEIKNATFRKPNNPDFVKYLIKENIATTLFINKLDYDIIEIPKYSVARWLHNKENNILDSLKAKMSPILFTAFSSIFLGYKNLSKEIEEDIKNKFKEWGIMHILARSGLHLIVFLLICSFLLKFIPIHFFIKQLIILFITIIYTLLSWTSTSFLRALCALILYKICPFIGKKTDVIHIVTIICFGIIILNPEQIFFLDFQLSFLLTFSLAIISKIEIIKKIKLAEKTTLKPLRIK